MSDGDAYVPTEVTVVDQQQPAQNDKHRATSTEIPLEEQQTNVPGSRMAPSIPLNRRHTLNLEDYFAGPRNMDKHSKWPLFMQMHGSILPKMIVPLIWMSAWSACVTCIYEVAKKNIAVNSILLTVLGFVVSTGLSFRGSQHTSVMLKVDVSLRLWLPHLRLLDESSGSTPRCSPTWTSASRCSTRSAP